MERTLYDGNKLIKKNGNLLKDFRFLNAFITAYAVVFSDEYKVQARVAHASMLYTMNTL